MQSISVLIFWGLILAHITSLILSRPAQDSEEMVFSPSDSKGNEVFQDIRFYMTEKQVPRVSFESSRLEIISAEDANFIAPSGVILDESGRRLMFESKEGAYFKKKNALTLDGSVQIDYQDYRLTCESGYYDLDKKLFNGKGSVESKGVDSKTQDKILIQSHKVFSYPLKKWSRFDGDVKGKITRKRRYQGGFDFEANQMEVDLENSRVDMKEDVKIKRESMLLSAQNSSIFLENYTKKLKYYELTDDVVIKQTFREGTSGRTINRTAYSEKLEGFVRDRKVILTGAPRVLSNEDIIRGSRIVLRENASIVEVDDSTSRINYRKQNNE